MPRGASLSRSAQVHVLKYEKQRIHASLPRLCRHLFPRARIRPLVAQALPNSNEYVENCIYDVCGADDKELVCEHIANFADACVEALAGTPMPVWRRPDLCREL